MRRWLIPVMLFGGAVAAVVVMPDPRAAAQSGSMRIYRPGPIVQPVQPLRQTFEQRFWNYLTTQKYRNWAPAPGTTGEAYEGSSPHGAYLKMYLNRKAAGNPKTLPNGSIIIKENYGPDGRTLMAITVMYRTPNYNPQAGDWYWVKYNADGTVAAAPPEKGSMPLAGRPAGCIKCHGDGADGGDFVFFNDNL